MEGTVPRPTGVETIRRRKLLDLYYDDGISKELFSEEEARLSAEIGAVRPQASERERHVSLQSELVLGFEQVAALLRDLDIETVWGAANESERRVLIEELVDSVTVFPDHLGVTVGGAPPGGCCCWFTAWYAHRLSAGDPGRRSSR